MKFHVITLFPDIVERYAKTSILGRAQEKKIISVSTSNPRDFTKDKHARVDKKPYGGGPGMVLEALPIIKAAERARGKGKAKIFLLSPGGKLFTNTLAEKLARKGETIILISGRYEGVDARVKKALRAESLSVGPYVLTGGELPALSVIDAISRRIPGVLGDDFSVEERRIAGSEVYTRPETFTHKGKKYSVPKVLLSGHHGKIDAFRKGKKK